MRLSIWRKASVLAGLGAAVCLLALLGRARAGDEIPLSLRARCRWDSGKAIEWSVHAVDRLFEASGGRALFLADGCAACHGTVGQGSRVSGQRLAPHTMPLQPFLYILRHPANNMPPYVAEVLSDADAGDIHAYLDSLPGPSQRVQDIPALNR